MPCGLWVMGSYRIYIVTHHFFLWKSPTRVFKEKTEGSLLCTLLGNADLSWELDPWVCTWVLGLIGLDLTFFLYTRRFSRSWSLFPFLLSPRLEEPMGRESGPSQRKYVSKNRSVAPEQCSGCGCGTTSRPRDWGPSNRLLNPSGALCMFVFFYCFCKLQNRKKFDVFHHLKSGYFYMRFGTTWCAVVIEIFILFLLMLKQHESNWNEDFDRKSQPKFLPPDTFLPLHQTECDVRFFFLPGTGGFSLPFKILQFLFLPRKFFHRVQVP